MNKNTVLKLIQNIFCLSKKVSTSELFYLKQVRADKIFFTKMLITFYSKSGFNVELLFNNHKKLAPLSTVLFKPNELLYDWLSVANLLL